MSIKAGYGIACPEAGGNVGTSGEAATGENRTLPCISARIRSGSTAGRAPTGRGAAKRLE